MKVFIITEGGKGIGLGHITRCLSIYEAFEDRGITPLFIVIADRSVKALLGDKNYIAFNWLKNEKKLRDLLIDVDIVIVDSYLADIVFYNKISKNIKVPVFIDDNNRLKYPEATIVNGSICAKDLNYPKGKNIKYLLGSEYAPIRKGFWDVKKRKIRAKIKNVMITLGGCDLKDTSSKLLAMLVDNYPDLNKYVVIAKGFSASSINRIKKKKDNRTQLFYCLDSSAMKNLMQKSDISISAGGQTLYELARMGLPTIAICVADNQVKNCNGWLKKRFIEYAGDVQDKDLAKKVRISIRRMEHKDFREKSSLAGQEKVDGKGAKRVVYYCLNEAFKNTIQLRKAKKTDVNLVYKLSNSKAVREVSFNPGKILLKDHVEWFSQKIKDKKCLFLIAEIKGKFLGQIRYDENGVSALISISLDEKYRSSGVGSIVLRGSIQELKQLKPKLKLINAFVKESNVVSIKFFEKNNFVYKGSKLFDGVKACEYVYSLRRNSLV